MTKLYDLIVRVPVFMTDDGEAIGAPQVTLPNPVSGAPQATMTQGCESLTEAVEKLLAAASHLNVTVIGDRP